MDQNTTEWKRWRHAGIGASDSNIIMGVSKYKKRSELLLEKQTNFDDLKDKDSGPIAELGHVAEALERPRFEMIMDFKFSPALLESEQKKFIRASYDGINESRTIVWEHKLVGEKMFNEIESGKCPDEYYPQIQHQFFVTPSLEKTYLCAVLYKKEMLKEGLDQKKFIRARAVIKRDDDYINNRLLPELEKFWSEVKSKKDWSNLDEIAKNREEINLKIKELESQKKELDKKIQDELVTSGNSNVSTQLFSYSYQSQTRSSYDYKKMKDDGIDVDKYKKESKFFVLKVTGKKNDV